MRRAVFAVTTEGAVLARRTTQVLDGDNRLFLKRGTEAGPCGAECFDRLSEAVTAAFPVYDALIFIMAAGIAVRMIAPHVVSKLSDPAVVVMDERGRHVISLLSGHIGGANVLAGQLAGALGAEAVITTATDVEELLAVDVLASEYALSPWPKSEIKALNSALLRGERIRYYIDGSLARADFYRKEFQKHGIEAEFIAPAGSLELKTPAALVTLQEREKREGILYLRPRRLIAGVGCRKGVDAKKIMDALRTACGRIGRETGDISLFASTVLKSAEPGLLQTAESLGKEIRFFENESLQAVIERYGLSESDFVKRQLGIGNVCEAAALACVQSGRFALTKTKFDSVTVALVWEK